MFMHNFETNRYYLSRITAKNVCKVFGFQNMNKFTVPKKTLGTRLKTQMTQFTSNPIVICFSVDIKAVLRYMRADNQAISFFLSLYS